MTSPTPPQCECGNSTSFDRKKSFLGFTKLICPSCKKQYDDPSSPLTKGYRITYWIIGVWIGLSLLNQIPILITAAQKGLDVFFAVLMEQWLLILFFLGAILALKKDAQIRKSTKPKLVFEPCNKEPKQKGTMNIGKARKMIITAGVFGLISAFTTLAVTIYVAQTGEDFQSISTWALLDVLLLVCCTFGIFMKSRTAAVIMLVYFFLSKIVQWIVFPQTSYIVFGIIFLIVYFEGVRGCFHWHHLKKQESNKSTHSITASGGSE